MQSLKTRSSELLVVLAMPGYSHSTYFYYHYFYRPCYSPAIQSGFFGPAYCFDLGDFFLLPHTNDLTLLTQQWGTTIAFARPLILEIGIGLLCFFQATSTIRRISRADQAEDIAKLEHQIVEEKKQLEADIQKLSEVLSYAANGRTITHANVETGKTLWPLASQVNNLLARLKTSRQSDAILRQTEADVARLTEVVHATRSGQHVVWPIPNGGIIDPLLTELRGAALPQTSTPTPSPSPRIEKRF